MGPVSFDESRSHLYFGRSDEIRELTSLVIARLLQIARSRIHRELTTEECGEYRHSKTCPEGK